MISISGFNFLTHLLLLFATCTCYLHLLLLNITCRDWKAIAATFVSSLMERPPAGHTGHIGHSRPTSNRNGPPSLSLSEGLILCQVSTLIDLGLSMLQLLSIRSCSSSSQSHLGQKWLNHQARCCLSLPLSFREGSGYQIGMNFWKNSKAP